MDKGPQKKDKKHEGGQKMADIIKAFALYGPRVQMGTTVKEEGLVKHIAGRFVLTRGVVQHVLSELSDAIIFFNRGGRPVKAEGIGVFSPGVDKTGTLKVRFRADKRIKNELEINKFSGKIKNRNMVGKSVKRFIALWNDEHPGDKIKKK